MRYKIFDFGRSTIDEGTYNFKKQWGAAPSPLYWADFGSNGEILRHKGTVEQSATDGTREQIASVIMKLPVTISTGLGTSGRKYLSL